MNYQHPVMLYADAVSVSAIVGHWLGYWPGYSGTAATTASFIWFSLQIYWAIKDRRKG